MQMADNIVNSFMSLQTHEWVLLLIFSLLFFLRTIYLIFFTGRILFIKSKNSDLKEPLSLIMALRNEESTLSVSLPPLLSISDADYELIAVDDFSSDNSLTVLGALKEKYERLRFSALSQETWYSVKMAQNVAIKAAKFSRVMLIPPTLSKFKPQWLSEISAKTGGDKEVVISYSNIQHDGTFFNMLYRIEYFLQQIRSFGFIISGLPYVISEENVAFKKYRYFTAGGYRNKVNELYANLELIINSFIKKRNTQIIFSGNTAVYKDEKITRRNYFDLLKKEIRISRYLPFSRRITLSLEEISSCSFIPVAVVLLVVTPELWPVTGVMLLIPAILRMFIIKKAISHLHESKLFLSSLIYALLLPCFKLTYRFYYNHNSRRKGWKSRK
jgi:hypothetical protein